jgi:biotin synthase
MEEITCSGLDLAFLVEPIGVEHSNEEIADTVMLVIKYGAKLSGAMARVPIEGTPLYELGLLPERRLAQIAAVTRLAAGTSVEDICVHPSSKIAMEWGANVAVADVGAVPRSIGISRSEWNGFDVKEALAWFKEAGYRHDQEDFAQKSREEIRL